MSPKRIHIFGASGSGTTTLGKALASKLSVRHLDADDYWQQTDPPYIVKNHRAGLETRSKEMHERWIARLPCPVARAQSFKPPKEIAEDLSQRFQT